MSKHDSATPDVVVADNAMFERNLQFFEKHFIFLYAILRDYVPQTELAFDEDHDPDIIFQGTSFYKQGARKHAKKQIEEYYRAPNRIRMSGIKKGNTDRDSEPVLVNMLDRAAKAGITFSDKPTTRVSYHTICLGFGLGQHIESLMEATRCRNLLIIEPNIDFLYQSLFVFDWQKFGEACEKDKRVFHILTDRNPDHVLSDLRLIYRQYGPASFDGLTVYEHYANSAFEPIKKFLSKDADLMVSGLGYFEDELNMIGNTYGMLSSGKELITKWTFKNPGMPVFIIGSGPSLDQAVNCIVENQDRAIIVSCGTSLGACLRIGVKPDFHVDMERGQAQIDLPRELQEHFSLDDIWLIGSTTLLPGVKDVFKKRAFFFRQTLSAYPVFSGLPDQCIRYPSPSVTNSGLSFAQDVGFQEFYFFGIDLGFRDADHHHSTATSYKLKWTEPHDRVFKGNFGGTILSNHFYSWTRDGFRGAVNEHSMGFRYYNCSDGAEMDNVIPMLPECVSLPKPTKSKQQVVEEITSHFTPYTRKIFDYYWRDGAIIETIKVIAAALKQAVEDHPDMYDKRYAQEITILLDPINNNNGVTTTLRGTLLQAILAVEYYLDRIEQDAQREAFAKIVREELTGCIQRLADIMTDECRILTATGRLGDRYDPGLM